MKTLAYLFLICTILTSCRSEKTENECVSSLENYKVVFHPIGKRKFPVNEIFNLEGKIIPLKNKVNLKDLKLDIEVIMPEHHHGMNVIPKITLKPDGTFIMEGFILHMPGKWLFQFYAEIDNITEAASYEVII